MNKLKYLYYVSFMYLDKYCKQKINSTFFPFDKIITNENDVNYIADMLRMHYNSTHLRVLAFSLMNSVTEIVEEIFKNFVAVHFKGKRWRQKFKARLLMLQ